MMKSRFQDLVEEIKPPRKPRKVSTGGLFVGLSTGPVIWGQKNQQFKPNGEDPNWQPDVPAEPEPVVDELHVMAELNLTDDLTIDELKAIRRQYARENHPDARPGQTAVRELRMKIANMIIDEHIQARRRG